MVTNTNAKLNKMLTEAGDKILEGSKVRTGIVSKIGNLYGRAAKALAKTSGKTKIIAALAAATVNVSHRLTRKIAYKNGQIDQKYNDRASMQQLVG